jgi:hypothetical protein
MQFKGGGHSDYGRVDRLALALLNVPTKFFKHLRRELFRSLR